jgi:hypothetical protein
MEKILAVLFLISSSAVAQKMKIISGSLTGLHNEKSYNIIFRYDSMMIGTDTPEKVYLREKRRQWEQKEQGRGSDFVEIWFTDRKEQYEPEFIRNFEKYAGVKLEAAEAEYTLILKTTRTEGGWSAGILNHPGEIDGELWVVETADKSRVIAAIGFYNFTGKEFYGGDFEMTDRIQSAYATAGKGLGDFFRRKSK